MLGFGRSDSPAEPGRENVIKRLTDRIACFNAQDRRDIMELILHVMAQHSTVTVRSTDALPAFRLQHRAYHRSAAAAAAPAGEKLTYWQKYYRANRDKLRERAHRYAMERKARKTGLASGYVYAAEANKDTRTYYQRHKRRMRKMARESYRRRKEMESNNMSWDPGTRRWRTVYNKTVR